MFALINLEWSSDTGRIQLTTMSRGSFTKEKIEGTPFGDLTIGRLEYIVADLKNADDVKRYEMFQKLADDGLTGYVAFSRSFGGEQVILSAIAEGFRGASLSLPPAVSLDSVNQMSMD